eukprot:1037124-Ditylum_brightwellii.AAC.1
MIACVKREHDNDRKGKHQDKPKSRHKRHHSLGNVIKEKERKRFATIMSHRNHIQPTHRITEQQRLQQVRFVKDAKRRAKKRGLTGKEVKDLNALVKDKVKEMIKESNHNMHTMSDFKDLSISSSNKSIQSIINDTSV